RNLRDAGIDAQHPTIQIFGRLWQQIQDLPRHLGQHSGGMVICQGRLDEVVPLENASMPDRVVIQWDKDDCADMGIVKVDLLGLGMMAVLQDALEVVNGAERGGWRADGGRFREGLPHSGLRHPVEDSTPNELAVQRPQAFPKPSSVLRPPPSALRPPPSALD